MNLLILVGFRVSVPRTPANPKGYIEYMPGMVIVADSIPADQSAQDWIDKDLARDATVPPTGEMPPESGAPSHPTL